MAVTCFPSPTLELDCPLVEYPMPAVEPAAEPTIASSSLASFSVESSSIFWLSLAG